MTINHEAFAFLLIYLKDSETFIFLSFRRNLVWDVNYFSDFLWIGKSQKKSFWIFDAKLLFNQLYLWCIQMKFAFLKIMEFFCYNQNRQIVFLGKNLLLGMLEVFKEDLEESFSGFWMLRSFYALYFDFSLFRTFFWFSI